MKYSLVFFILFMLTAFNTVYCQYTVNGNAFRESCNCYTLTQNTNTQRGSVWNNNRINLTQSFDFTFDVFLGCNDAGADGIAFVLQPISTSVGGNGSGLGYGGINPALGVTLDTYQNSSPDNDPSYDHIAIQLNGNVNHSSPLTITSATPISASSNNVEDCQIHVLKIVWDASITTMTIYFDAVQRLIVTRDFVNTVFAGNPLVFWGFTGATGGLSNLQRFCTSLTPKFGFLPTQKKCIGEPITFYDSTNTFGGVLKRYWNFGDGSPIDSININPTHTYLAAGNYNVTLGVMAIDSCTSTFNQTIRVGSKPVAGFYFQDSCVNVPIHFFDTSHSAVGPISNFYWDLDNAGVTSTIQNPQTTYPAPGIKNIKLAVKSIEGCTSDTLYKTIRIKERPVADFNFTDSLCLGSTYIFSDNSTLSDATINGWVWFVDGIQMVNNANSLHHPFTTAGLHVVGLAATGTSNADCLSPVVNKNVFVLDKPYAALKVVAACELKQVQLLDSSYTTDGVAIISWWWDLGNGQFSSLQNPIVTYSTAGPKQIKLVVRNSHNCVSDTLSITINVASKPVAAFGISKALCNNNTVQFYDSSTVTSATISAWQWINSGVIFSTQQNAVGTFNIGNNVVALVVVSDKGCTSDTAFENFVVKTKPQIAMHFTDTCKQTSVSFIASESGTSIGIGNWIWSFGDGSFGSGNPVTHSYNSSNNYTVQLVAISSEGCTSDTLSDMITIYGTNAFAGNDTIAASNQPVQLNASGGLSYQWFPSAGLSATNISNPIATNISDKIYYLKAFTPEGCESFDTISIKIYKGPEIYVPTAFTPNGDGINDILRAIPIGISEFEYFVIFNRYGEIIFKTSDPNKGWDGIFKGKQNTGSFIWMAAATDFMGNKIVRKGTVILIR